MEQTQTSPARESIAKKAWREVIATPETQALIEKITGAVMKGEIKLADVSGFSSEELDDVYAGACNMVSQGLLREALEIAGYLLILDPRNPRVYYLAGIGFHHLKDYAAAERFYGLALMLGDDPVTMMCRGEALMALGKTDEGREALERGIELVPAEDRTVLPYIKRARHLISTTTQGAVS